MLHFGVELGNDKIRLGGDKLDSNVRTKYEELHKALLDDMDSGKDSAGLCDKEGNITPKSILPIVDAIESRRGGPNP